MREKKQKKRWTRKACNEIAASFHLLDYTFNVQLGFKNNTQTQDTWKFCSLQQ